VDIVEIFQLRKLVSENSLRECIHIIPPEIRSTAKKAMPVPVEFFGAGANTVDAKQEVEYWPHQGIQQADGYPAKGGPRVSFKKKCMTCGGKRHQDDNDEQGPL